MQETQVQSLGQEHPLKEGMATHSSILAWRIPWTGEPGRLQSTGYSPRGHKELDTTEVPKRTHTCARTYTRARAGVCVCVCARSVLSDSL